MSVPSALLPAAWSHCEFGKTYCIYAPISCTPGTWTGSALRKLSSICWHFARLVATAYTYFHKLLWKLWKSVPEEVISLPLAMFLSFYSPMKYFCIQLYVQTLKILLPHCVLFYRNGSLLSFPFFRMQLNQLSTYSGLGFGDLVTRPGCAID